MRPIFLLHNWTDVVSDAGPKFDESPKKSDKQSHGKFSEGPELSSMRTRSFSFSEVTMPISFPSPGAKDEEEFHSFRKEDDEIVICSQPDVPGSAPARTKRSKTPSWDGFVSIFYAQKKEEAAMIEEQRTRSVDLFRPYLRFLQAPYNEAEYRSMMKPPLGGLATIISRDLKRMNSL